MNRRHLFIIFTILVLLAVFRVTTPFINNMVNENSINLYEANYLKLWILTIYSVILSLLYLYEGRKSYATWGIVFLWIATRVVDVMRFGAYPDYTYYMNLVTGFGGFFMCVFSLVYIHNLFIRNRNMVFVIIIGFLTFIRVPYNADILVLYIKNTTSFATGMTLYYDGVRFMLYPILIIQFLALDTLTKDKIDNKVHLPWNHQKEIAQMLEYEG